MAQQPMRHGRAVCFVDLAYARLACVRPPGPGCLAQVLYQKQGRNAQFDSPEERDEWLRSEMATLDTALGVKRKSHAELEAQVQAASAELMDLSQARPPFRKHVAAARYAISVVDQHAIK